MLDTDVRTAECLVLSGDPAGALELVASLSGSAGADAVAPVLHRVSGLALHALGRPQEAREALSAARAVLTSRQAEGATTAAEMHLARLLVELEITS